MATLDQVENNYSRDLRGLFFQLALTATLSSACILGFIVLRRSKRFGYLYIARVGDQLYAIIICCIISGIFLLTIVVYRKSSGQRPLSFIALVKEVYKLPDEYLVEHIGLDAAVFIRFISMCIRFCVIMSSTITVVLIPINLVMAEDDTEIKMSSGVERFSISAVKAPNKAYIAHAIATYFMSAVAYYLLYNTYKWFALTAQQYILMRAQRGDVHLRTVMVRGLPPKLRDEAKLLKYFSALNIGTVESVTLARNMQKLERKIKRQQNCLRELEKSHIKLANELHKGETRTWWRAFGHRKLLQGFWRRFIQCFSVIDYLFVSKKSSSSTTDHYTGKKYRTKTITRDFIFKPQAEEDSDYSTDSDNEAEQILNKPPDTGFDIPMAALTQTQPFPGDFELIPVSSPDNDSNAVISYMHLSTPTSPTFQANTVTLPSRVRSNSYNNDSSAKKSASRRSALSASYASFRRGMEKTRIMQESEENHDIPSPLTLTSSVNPHLLKPTMPIPLVGANSEEAPHTSLFDFPTLRTTNPSLAVPPLGTLLAPPEHHVSHLPNPLTWPYILQPTLRPVLDQYQPTHFTKHFGFIPTGREVISIDHYLSKLMYYDHRVQELREFEMRHIRYNPTPTAFIIFVSPISAMICAQSHTLTSTSIKTRLAPEPRDMIWDSYALGAITQRWFTRLIVSIVVVVVIVLWILPTSFVVTFVNLEKTVKHFPWLGFIFEQSPMVQSFFKSMLPTVIMTVFNILFPYFLFMLLKLQSYYSVSHFMEKLTQRYIQFSIFNTLIAFTIGQTLVKFILHSLFVQVNMTADQQIDLNQPFATVALFLPRGSTFYIYYVIFQANLHALELLQFNWGIFLAYFTTARWSAQTPRDYFSATRPWMFFYYYYYTSCILVMVITLAYSLVNPLIVFFALLYFSFAYMVFKHQLLYVYVAQYETNGRIWPRVFDWGIFGVLLAQIIMAGILALNTEFVLATFLLPLLGGTWWLRWHCHRVFLFMSRYIPLDSQVDGRCVGLDGQLRDTTGVATGGLAVPQALDKKVKRSNTDDDSIKSNLVKEGLLDSGWIRRLKDRRNQAKEKLLGAPAKVSLSGNPYESVVLDENAITSEIPVERVSLQIKGRDPSSSSFRHRTQSWASSVVIDVSERENELGAMPFRMAPAKIGRASTIPKTAGIPVTGTLNSQISKGGGARSRRFTIESENVGPIAHYTSDSSTGITQFGHGELTPAEYEIPVDNPQTYLQPCAWRRLPHHMWLPQQPLWSGVFDLTQCSFVDEFCHSTQFYKSSLFRNVMEPTIRSESYGRQQSRRSISSQSSGGTGHNGGGSFSEPLSTVPDEVEERPSNLRADSELRILPIRSISISPLTQQPSANSENGLLQDQ